MIPPVRFSGFSDNWQVRSFDDLFVFSTGKKIKQDEASPRFEIPCIRYGELYHLYDEVIDRVINYTNLSRNELVFSKGDEILLPSAGEDPLDIGSASALTLKDIAIGRTINILRPRKMGVYDPIFVAYYINSLLRKRISKLAKGNSISNVYNSDLKKLAINLPSHKEQEEIANFLVVVDEKITRIVSKIRLLHKYKKGIAQKIFSQQIRFNDDNGQAYTEWKEKKLGDLLSLSEKQRATEIDKDKILTVKLHLKGIGVSRNVDSLSIGATVYYRRAAGDLIYGKQNLFSGAIALIPEGFDGYLSSGDVPSLKINRQTVVPEYLLAYIGRKDYYKKLEAVASGSGSKRIHESIFLAQTIHLPSIEEQQKIATFLTNLDDRIATEQTSLTAAKQWKKELQQRMFI